MLETIKIKEMLMTLMNEASLFTLSLLFLCSFVFLNYIANTILDQQTNENEELVEESSIIQKLSDEEIANQYIHFLESLTKKNVEVNKTISISNIAFKEEDPRILIIYATQSNTSKIFAETIKKESCFNNLKVSVKNISEISNSDFKTNLVVLFFAATYGEGEPTDDALNFFRNLDIIEYNDCLHYSIFGLGSTKYEKFNQTAINLDNHLKKLKLNELFPLTLGDDSINIRKDFNSYKDYLYQELAKFFSKKVASEKKLQQFIDKNKLNEKLEDEVNEFEITIENSFGKSKSNDDLNPTIEDYDYSLKNYLLSKKCNVNKIEELRKSNLNGSTLRINYGLNEGLKFETGDNIGVYPTNSEEDVDFILKRLKLDPESVIRINKKKIKLSKKISIPDNFTIREVLSSYLDLSYKIE